MLIIGVQDPGHDLLEKFQGKWVEKVNPVDGGGNGIMFGIGQDKGGSSRGYTGTLVLQSFFINARIIFDANGAAAGLAGQKKPDPSLAAAIVQQNIPLPDPAGSSQAFQTE